MYIMIKYVMVIIMINLELTEKEKQGRRKNDPNGSRSRIHHIRPAFVCNGNIRRKPFFLCHEPHACSGDRGHFGHDVLHARTDHIFGIQFYKP